MITEIRTERLLLRPLLPSDDRGMFELDSDPRVHQFLGNNPVKTIGQSREVISTIRKQYHDNGIGRWAVLLKETGEFIGWSGLKLERNINGHEQFYDLGYRLIPKFWRQGYGFESAKAFVDFGFNEFQTDKICAAFEHGNTGSQRIMEKCGLRFVNDFFHRDAHGGRMCAWYEIARKDWLSECL
jgi:RimJ/RimL family protein N-acetyltransferase